MGMKIYNASGIFNPAEHGLKTGDELNIICVGGGQGGTSYSSRKGGNGATSSFGSIVSAVGGSDTTGQYINPLIGTGFAGGCGGFIPGTNDWGGIACSKGKTASYDPAPSPGSAGACETEHLKNKYEGISYGGGSGMGTGSALFGYGGGGYGAGGGSCSPYYKGGSSGKVEYATHKLASLSNISVLVGGGGAGGGVSANGANGSTSGGGAGGGINQGGAGGYGGIGGQNGSRFTTGESYTVTGGGGAGGCVIVFW